MKQFQNVIIARKMAQRSDGSVVKRRVGVLRKPAQRLFGKFIACKERKNARRRGTKIEPGDRIDFSR